MAPEVLRFLSAILIGLHVTSSSGPDYCDISSRHTMCRYKDTGALCGDMLASGVFDTDRVEILKIHNALRLKGTGALCGHMLASGVFDTDQVEILKIHNALRLKVSVGREEDQPPAADMHLMVWDNELASIAQRWANQCIVGHDRCRDVSRFSVGQNVHATTSLRRSYKPEWSKAVGAWYDEVKRWKADHIQPFRPVLGTADYTQLVWATSNRVGCGFSAFRRAGHTTKLYVCNYGPSGNHKGEALYIKGGPCSACPPKYMKCTSGLCSKGRKPFTRSPPPKKDPVPISHCPVGTFSYCGRCVSLVNIHRFCTFTAFS